MATYVPRLTVNTPTPMQGNPWWFSTGNIYYPAYGLPNCTCYAFGRFAEIRGSFANLSGRHARYWYEHTDSFARGSTPQLGAVACYSSTLPVDSGGTGALGHVSIVERIEPNGDIIVSESGWGAWFFNTERLTRSSGYLSSWMTIPSRQFYLQGFIYNDGYAPPPPITAQWHAKPTGGYARTDSEAQDNALMIYQQLHSIGWTLNAVSAMLGNMGYESSYNPWRWQGDSILSSTSPLIDTSYTHGYGLVQYTPSGKYIHSSYAQSNPNYAPNFSNITGNPNDGAAQVALIDHDDTQWIRRGGYNITFNDFKHSAQDIGYLTRAFLWNYEYPADRSETVENNRTEEARYWYNFLYQYDPGAIIIPTRTKPFKWWMYLRRW